MLYVECHRIRQDYVDYIYNKAPLLETRAVRYTGIPKIPHTEHPYSKHEGPIPIVIHQGLGA